MRKVLAIAAALAALSCIPPAAQAQDYPNKPITLIIGFAPGGPSDVMSRILGRRMEQELKQPLIAMGFAHSVKEVQYLVDSVDDDGSGEIGFEEFLLVLGGGGRVDARRACAAARRDGVRRPARRHARVWMQRAARRVRARARRGPVRRPLGAHVAAAQPRGFTYMSEFNT